MTLSRTGRIIIKKEVNFSGGLDHDPTVKAKCKGNEKVIYVNNY